jgi:hypothetical protein
MEEAGERKGISGQCRAYGGGIWRILFVCGVVRIIDSTVQNRDGILLKKKNFQKPLVI